MPPQEQMQLLDALPSTMEDGLSTDGCGEPSVNPLGNSWSLRKTVRATSHTVVAFAPRNSAQRVDYGDRKGDFSGSFSVDTRFCRLPAERDVSLRICQQRYALNDVE